METRFGTSSSPPPPPCVPRANDSLSPDPDVYKQPSLPAVHGRSSVYMHAAGLLLSAVSV